MLLGGRPYSCGGPCRFIPNARVANIISQNPIFALVQVYGEDVAILAGDALLCLAFEYICRETRGVAPERIVRVSHLYQYPIRMHPSSTCLQLPLAMASSPFVHPIVDCFGEPKLRALAW